MHICLEVSTVGWWHYTGFVQVLRRLFNARVWSCGICGGQSGAGASFLRVFRFPLPIFIPPIAPQSPSSIIWGLYNRPEVAAVPGGLSPTSLIIIGYSVLRLSCFPVQWERSVSSVCHGVECCWVLCTVTYLLGFWVLNEVRTDRLEPMVVQQNK
jgi:hypothetical protein